MYPCFTRQVAVAAVSSLILTGGVQAAVLDVPTDFGSGADAFVDQPAPNTNFGSDTHLYWRTASASDHTHVYLKFQIPTNITVTGASLELARLDSQGFWMRTYGVNEANETWSENAITWNNSPASVSAGGDDAAINASNVTFIGEVRSDSNQHPSTYVTVPFNHSDDTAYGADTQTALINFLNSDTNGFVTFAIAHIYGASGNLGDFASKEHASAAAPILHLTYEPIPEPASIALLAAAPLLLLRRR